MIRVLTMLGGWVAGIGSVIAAGAAVWLARRPERLQLRVVVERDFTVHGWGTNDFVQWDVVNIGSRPIMIERVGWIRRRKLRKVTESESVSPRDLPCTLQPGEDFCWKTPWHSGALAHRLGYPGSVEARIYTSIGDGAYPIGQKLRKYFRDERAKRKLERRRRKRKLISTSSVDEPSAPLRDAPSGVEADPPGDPTA